ncbi:hypothetical protein F4779DRAFT_573840 [Xylariaceae sp. FL0662B]|nr:hypothetical protein F4779DRAFT_573840 [Xylariaceae sp. FL0662B]
MPPKDSGWMYPREMVEEWAADTETKQRAEELLAEAKDNVFTPMVWENTHARKYVGKEGTFVEGITDSREYWLAVIKEVPVVPWIRFRKMLAWLGRIRPGKHVSETSIYKDVCDDLKIVIKAKQEESAYKGTMARFPTREKLEALRLYGDSNLGFGAVPGAIMSRIRKADVEHLLWNPESDEGQISPYWQGRSKLLRDPFADPSSDEGDNTRTDPDDAEPPQGEANDDEPPQGESNDMNDNDSDVEQDGEVSNDDPNDDADYPRVEKYYELDPTNEDETRQDDDDDGVPQEDQAIQGEDPPTWVYDQENDDREDYTDEQGQEGDTTRPADPDLAKVAEVLGQPLYDYTGDKAWMTDENIYNAVDSLDKKLSEIATPLLSQVVSSKRHIHLFFQSWEKCQTRLAELETKLTHLTRRCAAIEDQAPARKLGEKVAKVKSHLNIIANHYERMEELVKEADSRFQDFETRLSRLETTPASSSQPANLDQSIRNSVASFATSPAHRDFVRRTIADSNDIKQAIFEYMKDDITQLVHTKIDQVLKKSGKTVSFDLPQLMSNKSSPAPTTSKPPTLTSSMLKPPTPKPSTSMLKPPQTPTTSKTSLTPQPSPKPPATAKPRLPTKPSPASTPLIAKAAKPSTSSKSAKPSTPSSSPARPTKRAAPSTASQPQTKRAKPT